MSDSGVAVWLRMEVSHLPHSEAGQATRVLSMTGEESAMKQAIMSYLTLMV